MAMLLSEVLGDVYVFAARPLLVAGKDAVRRPVRWVHASEQLDIAPLLRGGELILMEGAILRDCTAAQQKAYLDSLLAVGVAGLAIETTERFPHVPSAMIHHADATGFPIIELRRRVPFVQICESVNSQLADSSLRRLQLADRMSMALSASVRDLVGIDAILQVLSRETRSDVVLTSLSGQELGRAGAGDASGTPLFTATVSFGGTVVATLSLRPDTDGDIYLISAALERAPEILAIALLNTNPPSPEDRMKTRFFSLLSTEAAGSAPEGAPQWNAIADRLGLASENAYLTLLVSFHGAARVNELTDALLQLSPGFVGQLMGTEYVAVLGFPQWESLEHGRISLIGTLRKLAAQLPDAGICLGPGARSRTQIPRCLGEAKRTVEIAGGVSGGSVLDARDFAVARLRHAITQEGAVEEFIDEQIGALLRRDVEAPGELFETLMAYAVNWGSKTDAAKTLNVQRQTLYQRLDKIFAAIGPLPAGSARIPGILTAVFLEQGRRQLGSNASRVQETLYKPEP